MIYIADYFAIGLVIILLTFFFDDKTNLRLMPLANKVFMVTLIMTALNAITDLLTGIFLTLSGIPLWLNILINTLYFITNLVTTSLIALYFFIKILEHTHQRHCKRSAYIALSCIFAVYLAAVIINIPTGILFYFDSEGNYCRGPLNAIGYIAMFAQMFFVLLCYFRNKPSASKPMRRALNNLFPVIPLCVIIQRIFPEIMLNSIFIAFTDAIIFMTFMSQRIGVHSLTELNDRYRFFEELNRIISKKEPFQVYLINLKNFGAINKKHGHTVGDEFLYQFAFSLEKALRTCTAFHMNGTVFALVSRYTYQSASDKQSGDLLDFLNRGIDFGQHHIEADYIVSHYISTGEESSSTEVYEVMEYSISKAHRTNQQYVRCNSEICKELVRRKYLRERLQKIDTEHGFEVWYQPIKCISTGAFCSMEALIRLREPDGTLISPAEFIPIAEQSGQISTVTWFVLDQVCSLIKRNPDVGFNSISINLPMSQLLEKGFVTRFVGTVDQAGISHNRICLEFTERTILDKFAQTQEIMNELTENGFRFYLDDFGVGYSNFNCLLQLPFQMIKFDAGMIHNQNNSKQNYTALAALTKIFHDMRLIVVAEGAENDQEADALAAVGVDRIQGFVYAHPMPEEDLLRFYQ